MEKIKKMDSDFLDESSNNETLMKDMIKREMLKRIEKRIEENDVVLIKNIKNMLLEKDGKD